MMRTLRTVLCVLVVCVVAAPMLAQEPAPGSGAGTAKTKGRVFRPDPKAVEAITRMVESMQKAWDAGDPAAYSAGMADDVDFITVTGAVVKGKKDLDQRHAELFRKYFKGSHQAATVRQTRFVRPRVVVCDVDIEITKYKVLPPGLSTRHGQPVRMRTRYVLSQEGPGWVITSGQSTERHDSGK